MASVCNIFSNLSEWDTSSISKISGSAGKVSDSVLDRPQNILRGVSLVLAAALVISIQDVIFKLFSSELTLWQIFALRGMLAVPMLLAMCWFRGMHQGIVKAALGRWVLLRSLFFTLAFMAFYAAIPFLSLSTVGAALYIAPIFVTLLSAYVIKEPVGLLGWLGVCLGFAGVIVLLQPSSDDFSLWAVLPVMGAGFYAFVHITTRTKCQGVPLAAIALSLNLVMAAGALIVSALLFWLSPQGAMVDAYPYIFGAWSTVELEDWLILALLAGFTIVIGMMLAGAYLVAPPSTVSAFEYSYLVFVAIWDIVFFDISPTFATVSGMILIVGAGLLVLGRRTSAA